jgi:hypothetical protein
MHSSTSQRRLAAVGLGLAALACANVPQRSTLSKAVDSEASTSETRAMEHALAINIPGAIEASSDQIIAKSQDRAVRRSALRFKMEVVPAYYMALFDVDPLVAALDVWVLSIQLQQYLSDGPGRDRFGAQQAIALDAATRIRDQVAASMKTLAKRPERFESAKEKVETWAQQNPIAGNIASRPSILPLLAQMAGSPDSSVWGAVGDVTATVGDIATRLDIYAGYLPKASRWQGELLVDEVSDRDDTHLTLSTFDAVRKTADRVNSLIAPDAIHEETGFAIAAFRIERVQTMAAVDKMRVDAQAYLDGQQATVLGNLNTQRLEVMAEIDRQRVLALNQIEELRKQTFADLDSLVSRTILKLALALALLLLLATALALAVVRAHARRNPSSAQH